jgi:UDP-N-acetyl-D-galactosamine dehydrogenase
MVNALKDYDLDLDVYDPWVDPEEVKQEYGLAPVASLEKGQYDAIILAVAHDQFKVMSANKIRALGKAKHVLYDLKYALDKQDSSLRL